MKKLLYAVVLLLGMSALFVSCNKENGGSSSSSIVGTWEVVWSVDSSISVGEIWKFEEGGTILIDGYPYLQYRYDASTNTLKMGGSAIVKVLSLTSNNMTWGDYGSGEVFVKFEKQ